MAKDPKGMFKVYRYETGYCEFNLEVRLDNSFFDSVAFAIQADPSCRLIVLQQGPDPEHKVYVVEFSVRLQRNTEISLLMEGTVVLCKDKRMTDASWQISIPGDTAEPVYTSKGMEVKVRDRLASSDN